jgi:hypothetical protein
MYKIKDYYKHIIDIQNKIEDEINSIDVFNIDFCKKLMNYTTTLYYNIFSHICLDELKSYLKTDGKKYIFLTKNIEKYISDTFLEKNIYNEIIRYQNISGLYIVWNIYENMIFNVNNKLKRNNFEKYQKKLLDDDSKLININGIRLTRNSLHNDGVYTNKQEYNFSVQNENFILKYKENVKPISIINIINELLECYFLMKKQKKSK